MSNLYEKYAAFNPNPLSLRKLLDFGLHIKKECPVTGEQESMDFLQKELPVRLANIMKEINLLPPELRSTNSVRTVLSWYELSFKEIFAFEEKDSRDPKGN